jgi:peptidoglycan/LPS O-acetylase OafA/YrhL
MNRLIFLEWARGVASLLVVLHHATLDAPAFYQYQPFHNLFYFGMAGVDFFFVLSGFIIYYIHSRDKATLLNIKRYILKRLIRVYPLFFLISFILLLSYIYFDQTSQRTNLFGLSFLINSFLLLPSSIPPLLSVSWTLVHEMFFYMLFVLIIINKKVGLFLLFSWGCVILFLNFNDSHLNFPLSFYLNIHNIEFIFWILIALILKRNIFLFTSKYTIYFFILSILIFILNGINQDYHFIKISYLNTTLIYALSSTLIIYTLALLSNSSSVNKISNKTLILLGASSYAIYLIHLPILSILHRIVVKLHLQLYIHPNIIFLLVVLTAILIGILTHIFIEKPMIFFLKNKFIIKKG